MLVRGRKIQPPYMGFHDCCEGPRESFAALVTLGLAHDEQVLTQILRARNDAVHIYRLPLADALRVTLPAFSVEFRKLHDGIRSHSGLMR